MGTIQIDGSTPKLTIGNATAEDATILFDGNAQDFYIALDDSADDLLIGLGSTVGTTPIIAIDENKLSTFSGAITVGVDDTGHDVKLFGATAGSFLLWDESANALLLTDSTPIQIGDAQDLTLYHDGTNSYITNKTGALKIATETSGIALTIGHTTSEVTIGDNLTTTGTLTVGSTAINTNGGSLTASSQWRVTTDFDDDANPITSNWEVGDTDGYGSLGSNMTESSGIFTFPSTGYWFIRFTASITAQNAEGGFQIQVETTTDNSSYGGATEQMCGIGADSTSGTFSTEFIFDVTNTTNCKCRFVVASVNSTTTTHGHSSQNETYATFIRLGDT